MVAVEITGDGVEVDPLSNMDIHPAAELFPLMQGQEFDDLVADIAEHGQREPVVMTPDGQLLDGRNRWRACAEAGVTPITRVETSEPWAYVISTNVHRRHLSESQRAMIGAKIAVRGKGYAGHSRVNGQLTDYPQPPTRTEAAQLLNVAESSIGRARQVIRDGTQGLQKLVEQGDVPVYTAARVAREFEPEQQEEFAQRVANGADPKKLAANLNVPSQAKPRESTARTDNRSSKRHQHITVNALHNLQSSLDALDLVLKNTDGLDPAITDEEAAQWLDGLSKGRGALNRVLKLLTDRKESNP